VELQTMNMKMNVGEISNWLHISPATIYSFCRRGEIPCTKINRRWRFERSNIETWLILKTLEICVPGKN
jgi:excisionase family DNA binding protein